MPQEYEAVKSSRINGDNDLDSFDVPPPPHQSLAQADVQFPVSSDKNPGYLRPGWRFEVRRTVGHHATKLSPRHFSLLDEANMMP